MKTTMKKLIRYAFSTAALLCAFACVSCSGLFDSSSKNTSAETGTAVFSIASSTSTETASASTRTAAPAAGTVMAQVTSWTLANGDTTYSGTADTAAETVTFTGVPWNQALSVTLSGVNSSNTVIVTATKTITLTSSANTTSVMLEPVAASGTGEVAITITVSDGLTLDVQTPYVYLIPVGSGTTTSISGTAGTADATTGSVPYTFTGSSVSAGLYQVCVGFSETYSADNSYTFMSDDYLAVYAGCISTASYDSSSIYELNGPSVTYFVSSSGTGTGSLSSPLSLAGAITKINASTTSLKFRLLDNITYSGTDSITNKCTIDLGGHTLTVSGITSSAFVNLTAGVTVILENGTIKNTAEQTSPLFNIASSNTLSLTDITVSGMEKSTDNVYAPIESVGAVNLTNADIENGDCSYAFYAGSASGTLYIDDTATTFDGKVKANSIQYDVTPTKGFTVEPASISTSAVTLFTAGSTNVSINTSLFTLWDTTNYYYTSSGTIMPVQELTWYGSSDSGTTLQMTYAENTETLSSTVTNTSYDSSTECFTSAIDRDGQIYILYSIYSSSSYVYHLYVSGTDYTISSLTTTAIPNKLALCVDSDDSVLIVSVSTDSKTSSLYVISKIDGTYTASSITSLSCIVTALAEAKVSDTTYLFYSYVDTTSSMYYKPALYMAKLTNSSGSYTLATGSGCDISVSDISSTDTSYFRSGVRISDMLVSDKTGTDTLYLLISDTIKGYSYCNFSTDSGYTTITLNSRGALISTTLADLVTDLAQTTPALSALTVTGWNGTAMNLYDSSGKTNSGYLEATTDYTNGYFAGAQKFIALKPKELDIADYGIYVSTAGSSTSGNASQVKVKNGKAVFDLSSSVSFTSESDAYAKSTYGYYGSLSGVSVSVENSSTY